MKQTQHPVLFTIGFGMVAGIMFIPATMILNYIVPLPFAFNLIIWGYLVLYCGFLSKWRHTQLNRIVMPIALLFGIIIYGVPVPLFMLISLGTLAWVRSGICIHGPGAQIFLTELLTSVGGAALVTWFTPNSSVSWAVGTFLFFLVQALYFPLTGIRDEAADAQALKDPFENARKEAEKIISECRF